MLEVYPPSVRVVPARVRPRALVTGQRTYLGVSEHGIGEVTGRRRDASQQGGGGISCIFITQGNFLPTLFNQSLTATFQQSTFRPHTTDNCTSTCPGPSPPIPSTTSAATARGSTRPRAPREAALAPGSTPKDQHRMFRNQRQLSTKSSSSSCHRNIKTPRCPKSASV